MQTNFQDGGETGFFSQSNPIIENEASPLARKTVYMGFFPARLPRSRVKKPRSRQAGQPFCPYKTILKNPLKWLWWRDLGKRASPPNGLARHPCKHSLRGAKECGADRSCPSITTCERRISLESRSEVRQLQTFEIPLFASPTGRDLFFIRVTITHN